MPPELTSAAVGVAVGPPITVPSFAIQPHGSVIVTGTAACVVGPAQPMVQVCTPVVKPCGMWPVPVDHVGVDSEQLSVTVYVAGTVPVGHRDMYVVV